MPFEAPSCLTLVNFISNLTKRWAGVGEVGGRGKSMATTKPLQPSRPEGQSQGCSPAAQRGRARADGEQREDRSVSQGTLLKYRHSICSRANSVMLSHTCSITLLFQSTSFFVLDAFLEVISKSQWIFEF